MKWILLLLSVVLFSCELIDSAHGPTYPPLYPAEIDTLQADSIHA